ncbi:InlB B-repeat-containing protein [Bifidobacterium sp. ESL0769]|uniref:InlB B-repeat-containing protein n=1 Tax=Bifidobacterium sp. ESL0769 TaxID=2983229 RepID=UPI0023F6D9FC|nr:InlB B-repeat-containing protein [Bifidobacterium sp. ESL0769]WEV67355.1 InlB B-repeat-containing protein [Bifidobacterium sp. ESL0769]
MVLPTTATAVEPESGEASQQSQSQSSSTQQSQAASPEQSQSTQSQQSQKKQKSAESSEPVKQGKSSISAKSGLQPRGGGMVVGPQSVCMIGYSTIAQCFQDAWGDSARTVLSAMPASVRPTKSVWNSAQGKYVTENDPDGTFTQQRADSITSLDFAQEPPTALDGVRYMRNLQTLSTNSSREASFTDLSPLSGLTNLRSLSIGQGKVADLSPLSGLTNLQSLSCVHNRISDFSPLRGLTRLTSFSGSRQEVDKTAVDDGVHVTISTMGLKDIGGSIIGDPGHGTITPSPGGVYDASAHVVRWPTGTANTSFVFDGTLPPGVTGVEPHGTVKRRVCSLGSSTVGQCFPDVNLARGITGENNAMDPGGSYTTSSAFTQRMRDYLLANIYFGMYGGNGVRSIDGMENLTKTTMVSVGTNWAITDYSPLSGMAALRRLSWDGTSTSNSDVGQFSTALSDLHDLTALSFTSNHVSDFSSFRNLSHLTSFGGSAQDVKETAYDDGQYVTMSTADVKNIDGTIIGDPGHGTITPSAGGTYDASAHVVRWPSGTTNPKFDFTGTLPGGVTGTAPSGTVKGNPIIHAYNVSYDAGLGTWTGKPGQSGPYTAGDTVPALSSSDISGISGPDHYHRDGWEYRKTDSTDDWTAFTFDSTPMPAYNITVRPKWVVNSSDVTFDLNGGTWDGAAQGAVPAAYDSTPSEPANLAHLKAPAHKQRSGWQYRKTDSTDDWAAFAFGSTHMPDYAITIRPTWEAIPRHVTYDNGGGTWTSMPGSPVAVGEDETVSAPPLTGLNAPSNKHQDTATSGWEYRKTDSTENWAEFKFGVTHVPAFDITVRPKWVTDQYNVSYATGDGASWSSMPSGSTAYDYGSTIPTEPPTTGMTAPAHKHRDGWEYKASTGGWNTFKFGAPGTGTEIPASNITIRPKWVLNTNSLSYVLNGGSGGSLPAADPSVAYGTALTAPAASALPDAPTGHEFDKWQHKTGSGNWTDGFPATMPDDDVQIRPAWKAKHYNLTFDLGGAPGTAPNGESVAYGTSDATDPGDPTWTGHTFHGWKDASSNTWTFAGPGVSSPSLMPANDVVLTAQWTLNTNSVTFKDRGSTVATRTNVGYGTLVTPPTDPTRTGYTFKGWRESGASADWVFSGPSADTMPDRAVTLEARWEVKSYDVSYNLDGGSWPSGTGYTPVTGSKDFGTTLPAPTAVQRPTKTGYTFDSWSYTVNGGTSQTGWPNAVQAGAMVITAHWRINHYNVTYNLGSGGAWQGGYTPVDGSQEYGTTLPAPATNQLPTRPGHAFNGWEYTVDGGSAQTGWPSAVKAGAMVITAKWRTNSYGVTYDLGSGGAWQGGYVPVSGTQPFGTTLPAPTTGQEPTRPGYTFRGWEYTVNGGTPVSGWPASVQAGAMVVTALWDTVSYDVSYDLGSGGAWQGGYVPVSGSQPFGTALPTPTGAQEPTRSGYTFQGWQYTVGGGSAHAGWPTTVQAGDTAIKAIWTTNSYNVTYDLGTGGDWRGGYTPVSGSQPFGTALPTPTGAQEPTRTGYTFRGWQYTVGGGSAQSGWPASVQAGTMVVTALWDPVSYNVSYNLGAGGAWRGGYVPVSGSQPFGTTLPTPTGAQEPARSGHSFSGWQYTVGGGSAQSGWPSSVQAGDMVVTALWDTVNYNVSYDLGTGGRWPSSYTPVEGSTAFGTTLPAPGSDPTRAGYTFQGWQYTVGGGSAQPGWPTDVKAGDMVITALWRAKHYNVSYVLGSGASWQGGYTPVDGSQEYGTTLTAPTTLQEPARPGYAFGGWSYTVDGGASQAGWPSDVKAGNMVITASWTRNSYNVSYALGDGSWPSSYTPVEGSQPYGTTLTEPTTAQRPTRTGYSFDGWSYTVDGGASQTGWPSDVKAGGMVITAHWRINQYDVSYDLGSGGSWSGGYTPVSGSKDFGTALPAPGSDPTRPGFTFDHWEYTVAGGTAQTGWPFDVKAGNMVITAKWTRNNYNVSYALGGGSWPGSYTPVSGSKTYGTTLTEPTAVQRPTRTGFAFDHWSYTVGGGPSQTGWPSDVKAGDMVITASWTRNSYNVSYALDGGAWPGSYTAVSGSQPYGTTLTEPTTVQRPTRAGYTFDSWSYTVNGGTPQAGWPADVKAGAMVITAHWRINQYNVSYDLGTGGRWPSGTGYTPVTGSNNFGTSLPAPSAAQQPTRHGYDFDGWSYTVGGSAPVSGWPADVKAGAMVITAAWRAHTHAVAYEANGGTGGSLPATDPAVPYDTALTEPTALQRPTPPSGKSFAGWRYAKTGTTDWDTWVYGVNTTPDYDITIQPVWSANPYNVSYDANGGVGGSLPATGPMTYGSALTAPTVNLPEPPTGYSFDKWQYKVGSGSWIDGFPSDVKAGDMVIRMTWKINHYTVHYDRNNGSALPADAHPEYGTALTAPSNPNRTGHTFASWRFQVAGGAWQPGFPATVPAGDTVIQPTWTTNPYNVSYDANGGVGGGLPATASILYGTALHAPTVNLPAAPAGHSFDKWQYKVGSGSWIDGFPADVKAGDMTIRMTWKTNWYRVTFDLDHGTGSAPAQTIEYNHHATAPGNNPTREHYRFDFWTLDGSHAYDFDATPVTGPCTLKAHWTRITHTITFNVEGGITIAPRTIADGDQLGTLPTPTRTHFRFDGWFVESMVRSLVPYDPTAPVTGDITVIARWTRIEPDNPGWLVTRPGQEWLGTQPGHEWLGTQPGHEWLGTQPGHEWLDTQPGHEWLQTPEGQHWSATPEGHAWVSTPQGHQWLETPQGHAWLQTPEGSAWLGTSEGHAWISSPEGHGWLNTPEGHAWLGTPAGGAWLGTTTGGHAWLATAEGQHWLSTPAGAAWLATAAGHAWLATPAGAAWLKTPAGQNWLKTLAGQAWLATPEGRKWLASQAKPQPKVKSVAATGSDTAVPLGLMVSALIMALGLQLIRRRRRD